MLPESRVGTHESWLESLPRLESRESRDSVWIIIATKTFSSFESKTQVRVDFDYGRAWKWNQCSLFPTWKIPDDRREGILAIRNSTIVFQLLDVQEQLFISVIRSPDGASFMNESIATIDQAHSAYQHVPDSLGSYVVTVELWLYWLGFEKGQKAWQHRWKNGSVRGGVSSMFPGRHRLTSPFLEYVLRSKDIQLLEKLKSGRISLISLLCMTAITSTWREGVCGF